MDTKSKKPDLPSVVLDKAKKCKSVQWRNAQRMKVGDKIGETFDMMDMESMKMYTFEVIEQKHRNMSCKNCDMRKLNGDCFAKFQEGLAWLNEHSDGSQRAKQAVRNITYWIANSRSIMRNSKVWPCGLCDCQNLRIYDDNGRVTKYCNVDYKIVEETQL